jgi:uncharacterized repeat protein (TIGR01451 family)
LPLISGNVTIRGNGAAIERVATAPQFGLVFVTGVLTVDRLTLMGGSAFVGGGIYTTGTVTLTNSTVSNNTASNGVGGGGIFNTNGTVTLTDSTVSNNTASIGGGGIFNNGGTVTLTNSTISGNSEVGSALGGFGGGIDNASGSVTLTNSTVSGNTASRSGGGIAISDSVTVASSIVSGNTGANCAGTVTTGGYNLDSDGTCGLTAATDKNNVDPQLGPLQANGGPTETMAPASTSPVVDLIPKGTNGCGTVIETDQRGVLRPQGAGCDTGAYETGDVAMQALAAKPKSVLSGANVTYTATVVNAGAADATGVTVADTLPTGLKFLSAKASQGSCAFASPTLTCLLGQVPAAGTARVKLTVTVTVAATTTVNDTATVSATTGDTIPSNDSRTAKVKVT